MQFLETKTIHKAISKCKPIYIAVAFIGIDWTEYIDYSLIKLIIVSPTVGSNPNAIESLARRIGWEKIYFLDNLHAKIYLGRDSAVVGSANLTRNGLSVNGLEESAIAIDDSTTIQKIGSYIDQLKSKAQAMYPDVDAKKLRLSTLKRDWSNAISNSVIQDIDPQVSTLENYEPLCDDDFYITWYQDAADSRYSDEVESLKSAIDEELYFAEDDEVEKGKWILSWKMTKKSLPNQRITPKWQYIDEVIKHGIIADDDYPYTKIAIARHGKIKPIPPFELTKAIIEAFNDLVKTDKYRPYFIGDNEPFYVKYSFCKFKEFIDDLKCKVYS